MDPNYYFVKEIKIQNNWKFSYLSDYYVGAIKNLNLRTNFEECLLGEFFTVMEYLKRYLTKYVTNTEQCEICSNLKPFSFISQRRLAR